MVYLCTPYYVCTIKLLSIICFFFIFVKPGVDKSDFLASHWILRYISAVIRLKLLSRCEHFYILCKSTHDIGNQPGDYGLTSYLIRKCFAVLINQRLTVVLNIHPLIWKCHFVDICVISCIYICQFDNFWCIKWQQIAKITLSFLY